MTLATDSVTCEQCGPRSMTNGRPAVVVDADDLVLVLFPLIPLNNEDVDDDDVETKDTGGSLVV